MPFRQWIKSANHALEGILHGAKTQRHLRYHFFTAAAVLFLSYILGISTMELIIVSLAVILVLLAEMLNSAIEIVVDIVSPEYSEKARNAKDIAAGAVLITAFGAALLGYIVLFPYIKIVFIRGMYIAKHTREEVALIALVLVLILVVITKTYFRRGTPLRGGMPSGHTALAFSVWVSATFITGNVVISILCFILASWIAQSRVGTKVHSIWEVVLGGLMGSALTFLLFRLFT